MEKQSAKKCICIKGELFMIVPRYYEDLSVLHENTMPARAYFIPASKVTNLPSKGTPGLSDYLYHCWLWATFVFEIHMGVV